MTDEFMGDQPNKPAEATPPQATGDLSALLAAITTPDGRQKYATPEAALIGLANAQAHISTLEAENASFKGLATKVETMEAVLQRLGEGNQPDPVKPPVPQGQAPQGASVADIERIVQSTLTNAQKQQQEVANRRAVKEALTKRFGEKVDEAMATKAAALGLTVGALGTLAATSPAAVLAFFAEQSPGTPGVQGSVNTQGIAPSGIERAEPPKDLMLGGSFQDAAAFWKKLGDETKAEMGLT